MLDEQDVSNLNTGVTLCHMCDFTETMSEVLERLFSSNKIQANIIAVSEENIAGQKDDLFQISTSVLSKTTNSRACYNS